MSIVVKNAENLPITASGLREFAKTYRKHFPDMRDYEPNGQLCRRLEKAADEIERLEGERRKLLDNAQTLQGAIDRLCGQNKRLEKENARFRQALLAITNQVAVDYLLSDKDIARLALEGK